MKMKQVNILIGSIGSGKTTLSKRYVDFGYVVISRDGLRYSIGNGEYIFDLEYEAIIGKTEMFMLRKFLKLGVNIIIDECNVSKALRKRLIKVIRDYEGYKITALVLYNLSKEESIQRRLKDNHGETDMETWEMIWDSFDSIYEETTHDEGFDEVLTLDREGKPISKLYKGKHCA